MANEVRLINVNEAIEKINCLCVDGNDNWIGTDNQSFVDHADVIDILSDMPTVDAVPVVHGVWVEVGDGVLIGKGTHFECSECRMWTSWEKLSNYCPHCGAKMNKGEEI